MTQRRPRVGVVGSGLAGLAAAVAAQEAGAEVVLLERHESPGGASLESAGWIWRYRDARTFRACAPAGDARVQSSILDHFDTDVAWLVQRDVRLAGTETGRDITRGVRVDPAQLVAALVGQLGNSTLMTDARVTAARRTDSGAFELQVASRRGESTMVEVDQIVFAGGGYAADTVRIGAEAAVTDEVRAKWQVRPRFGGDGSSQHAALELGALLAARPSGECFVRLVADGADPTPAVLRAVGELQVPGTTLRDATGRSIPQPEHDWSGAHAGWTLARTSGAGTLVLPMELLDAHVHSGRIRDVLAEAAEAGARVTQGTETATIDVAAGLTHTLCGVAIDGDGRTSVDGVLVAGCDAAGAGAGGYASGLAQALVTGRRAGTVAARSWLQQPPDELR